jgi:hypothetical protein
LADRAAILERGLRLMPRIVKYRKPRKINVVTILLGILAAFLVYLGYQYIPNYMLEQEAYRVLEETSSHFAGRKSRYLATTDGLVTLRRRMHNQLRLHGVDDPDAESWIEVDGHEVRFGVIYSKWIEWPFDIIPKQEKVYEIEHTIVIRTKK